MEGARAGGVRPRVRDDVARRAGVRRAWVRARAPAEARGEVVRVRVLDGPPGRGVRAHGARGRGGERGARGQGAGVGRAGCVRFSICLGLFLLLLNRGRVVLGAK